MNNLKFRRQFLFSAKKCKELNSWRYEKFGEYNLYIHPDCEFTRVIKDNLDLGLIGYFINPKIQDKSNLDILIDISKCIKINEVIAELYGLVGRFVLIMKKDCDYTFFHDACGLRSIYYTISDNSVFAASQPLLLKLVIDIEKGSRYYKYYESEYVKSNIEHWIPSGISLYNGVYHLLPNHYLDVSKFKQVRFWPNKPIKKREFFDSVEEFSTLLKSTMLAANLRFKLALALTAGWDSRTILSACKDIAHNIFFYTLQYRKLSEKSNDIKVSKKLTSKLGFKHHIIDCRKPIIENFIDFYKNNTDMPHVNDWGIIANGIYLNYPSNRVAIKGNCAEIGRCFYYKYGVRPATCSSKDFLNLEFNWRNIDFIKNQISEWYEGIKDLKVHCGYDLLDLFYWEHRMGSYQSQSQLEWDIVQETFTPFNNRELIDIMLSVEPKYRSYPNYIFLFTAIQKLWKETLSQPINQKSIPTKIKEVLIRILLKIGIFNVIYRIIKG